MIKLLHTPEEQTKKSSIENAKERNRGGEFHSKFVEGKFIKSVS